MHFFHQIYLINKLLHYFTNKFIVLNSGKYCLVKYVIHDPLYFIVYSGKHTKNKVLRRGKHDTTAAC